MPTRKQKERATELRSLIRDLASGRASGEVEPKTPREITDEAARRKRAAARRRKRAR